MLLSIQEQFAQTVNKLKGKITILFITYQLPKSLQLDVAVVLEKENIHVQPNSTQKGQEENDKTKN